MVAAPKTIDVEPGSELARILDEAAKAPVILARNGARFRLERMEDFESDYDPEAARAEIRAMAGSISVDEAERIKEYIYRGREEGTRPIDRP